MSGPPPWADDSRRAEQLLEQVQAEVQAEVARQLQSSGSGAPSGFTLAATGEGTRDAAVRDEAARMLMDGLPPSCQAVALESSQRMSPPA